MSLTEAFNEGLMLGFVIALFAVAVYHWVKAYRFPGPRGPQGPIPVPLPEPPSIPDFVPDAWTAKADV